MRRRAGLRYRDYLPAANDPGERGGGGGATMRGADLLESVVVHHEVVIAAERRICYYRHVALPAPRQEVMLDVTVVEAVGDLIGGATMAVRNTEQVVHLSHVEVGYTPCPDLPRRAQPFECRHDAGKKRAPD